MSSNGDGRKSWPKRRRGRCIAGGAAWWAGGAWLARFAIAELLVAADWVGADHSAVLALGSHRGRDAQWQVLLRRGGDQSAAGLDARPNRSPPPAADAVLNIHCGCFPSEPVRCRCSRRRCCAVRVPSKSIPATVGYSAWRSKAAARITRR